MASRTSRTASSICCRVALRLSPQLAPSATPAHRRRWGSSRTPGGECSEWRSGCNHSDMPANQIDRKLRQSIELTLSPAKFERNVLAFDVSGLLEALAKSAQIFREGFERCGVRYGDHRHRRCARAAATRKAGPERSTSWNAIFL